ncbi:MAG TPA: BTAD domain-containing putative transcriptional regulator [Jatrophihabitans sp.]|jgi:DNA-binding SARP family transcriptional activator|uniref:AfsR/SARP family transcriptional regulator n=1 Tax=Jatrophihabitans sp. TaxID=1932789 RepID=UPI002F1AFE1E
MIDSDNHLVLSLLGGFSLRIAGQYVALPMHSRRVLAWLSLDKTIGQWCDRGVLAERLWPDATTERSRASLRTALWRIRRASSHLVLVEVDHVVLSSDIQVDLHHFRSVASKMIAGNEDLTGEITSLVANKVELLPGWDETWLLLAREQLRQMRLHALEGNARRLQKQACFPEAIDAMLAVVAEEPLRESSQTTLIQTHLRSGNRGEARRQFDLFTDLLWSELRLRPAPDLYRLVGVPVPVAPARVVRPAGVQPARSRSSNDWHDGRRVTQGS